MSTIRQTLQKIQFKLDKLETSFRIAAFIVFYCLIIGLWYRGIYSAQNRARNEILQHIANLNQKNAELEQKRNLILNIAKLPMTQQLLKEHERLKHNIEKVDQQIQHYQHRFIDEQMLYNLLHGLLIENPEIYIDMFETFTVTPPAPVIATSNQKSSKPLSPKPPAAPIEASPNEIHYILEIKGNYLSILNFLSGIEKLSWQLFWQKMDFKVGEYPNSTARITFYTLKAPNQPSSAQFSFSKEVTTKPMQLTRDPVKPFFPNFHVFEKAIEKVIDTTQSKPIFHLQSIVIGRERKFALINDHYLNVGDRINGGYVAAIHNNFVILNMPEGRITLYLFEQQSW